MTGAEKSHNPSAHAGLTLLEALVVALLVGVLATILLPAVVKTHESSRRASCASNLKQVGSALRMYAAEHSDRYPPMRSGVTDTACNETIPVDELFVHGPALVPDYLDDPRVLVCPSDYTNDYEQEWYAGIPPELDPCLVSGISYTYIDWAITDEILIAGDADPNSVPPNLDAAFVASLGALIAAPPDVSELSFTSASDGPITIFRLRPGIERRLITDTNSVIAADSALRKIPVFFDHFVAKASALDPPQFNHWPTGGNVLYLDGHVEFETYPTRYPASAAWAATFGLLVELAETTP